MLFSELGFLFRVQTFQQILFPAIGKIQSGTTDPRLARMASASNDIQQSLPGPEECLGSRSGLADSWERNWRRPEVAGLFPRGNDLPVLKVRSALRAGRERVSAPPVRLAVFLRDGTQISLPQFAALPPRQGWRSRERGAQTQRRSARLLIPRRPLEAGAGSPETGLVPAGDQACLLPSRLHA